MTLLVPALPAAARGVRHFLTLVLGLVALLAVTACETTATADTGETVLTESQLASLTRSVRAFNKATLRKDGDKLVDYTPPKVTAEIARRNGITVAHAREVAAAGTRLVLALAEFESFDMDVDGRREGVLSSGEPYAWLPTTSVIKGPDGGRSKATSQTLALFDDNRWYLVRVAENEQRELMRLAYPAFAAVRVPRARMETL